MGLQPQQVQPQQPQQPQQVQPQGVCCAAAYRRDACRARAVMGAFWPSPLGSRLRRARMHACPSHDGGVRGRWRAVAVTDGRLHKVGVQFVSVLSPAT